MQFSLSWLNRWINWTGSTEALSKKLYSLGLEVENICVKTLDFSKVKVARVVAMRPHPNASKLNIASVLLQEGQEPIQVVCGAKNCRTGLTVAYALPGAYLGSRKLETVHLRGEISHGMLCAPSELGLTFGKDGLWELPSTLPLGSELIELLEKEEILLDVSVTPNRADCFCVKGIARELASKTDLELLIPRCNASSTEIQETVFPFKVRIDRATVDLKYYAMQYLKNIELSKNSALRLQQHLLSAGLTPINAVVDTLNFFMLDQGQPMHAFDADQVVGTIEIRRAKLHESCTTLNGEIVKFTDYLPIVVADDAGILCVAGIVGGARAAITAQTKNVLLEAAVFPSESIARARQCYGFSTEASTRYERGVDPSTTRLLLTETVKELSNYCAAGPITQSKLVEFQTLSQSMASQAIFLEQSMVQDLLGGRTWQGFETEKALTGIGCQMIAVVGEHTAWHVFPPTWRFDLSLAEDLIEAIARYIGYDEIALEMPFGALYQKNESFLVEQSNDFDKKNTLRSHMAARGFYEVCSFAFTSPEQQAPFSENKLIINVPRPISASLSQLKASLVPGLLDVALFNLNRQQSDIRLFEIATCFNLETNSDQQFADETLSLGILLTRSKGEPIYWSKNFDEADFFELKGECLAALTSWGYAPEAIDFVPVPKEGYNFLHPTQRAMITYRKEPIGFIGQMAPSLREKLKIGMPVFLTQVSLSSFMKSEQLCCFSSILKFPLTRRDLSFGILLQTPVGEVLKETERVLSGFDSSIDVKIELSDLYLPEAQEQMDLRKYVNLTFLLQAKEKNLTEHEISCVLDAVTERLNEVFHAKLRHEF